MTKGARLRTYLREPTLHFALLAGLLFAASAAVRGPRARRIEIDPAQVAARVARIEATAGIRLAPEQRRQVEDDYIDQRVLAREARARGLQEDAQVEDLLAQKMLDVLSADVIQPTDAELLAYYTENTARYATPERVTVEEVVVEGDAALPPGLRAELEGAASVAPRPGVEVDVLEGVTRADLGRVFGEDMAARVVGAPDGAWSGPHRSVRGRHWLRVVERQPSAEPPLDSLRDRVRMDWVASEERTRLHRRVEELRARYTIVFEGGESR